ALASPELSTDQQARRERAVNTQENAQASHSRTQPPRHQDEANVALGKLDVVYIPSPTTSPPRDRNERRRWRARQRRRAARNNDSDSEPEDDDAESYYEDTGCLDAFCFLECAHLRSYPRVWAWEEPHGRSVRPTFRLPLLADRNFVGSCMLYEAADIDPMTRIVEENIYYKEEVSIQIGSGRSGFVLAADAETTAPVRSGYHENSFHASDSSVGAGIACDAARLGHGVEVEGGLSRDRPTEGAPKLANYPEHWRAHKNYCRPPSIISISAILIPADEDSPREVKVKCTATRVDGSIFYNPDLESFLGNTDIGGQRISRMGYNSGVQSKVQELSERSESA
ncbi:hypothetical protein BV22DRAFT_1052665, partial [Leucogyrophana mollusca]